MSLIRSEKNVYCHMVSEEYTAPDGIREWTPGEIQISIYDSKRAAVTDLKGVLKLLKESGHKNVHDFSDEAGHGRIEWTDAWTGVRMRRWITDLPFFHG